MSKKIQKKVASAAVQEEEQSPFVRGAFLGPQRVADMLGFDRVTLFKWVKAGKFPRGVQLFTGSKRQFWRRSDIEAWVASRPQHPGSFPQNSEAAA